MNSLVWIIAGLLILAGIWLSQTVNARWIALSILAGGYLIASGLTGWSPIEHLFLKPNGRKRPDHHTRKK